MEHLGGAEVRNEQSGGSRHLGGGVSVCEKGRWLNHGHQRVNLTKLELRLLTALHDASGPVPKADLLAGVWGIRGRSTRAVDHTLCRLRAKLASLGAPNLVETTYGRGLCLIDPTVEVTP